MAFSGASTPHATRVLEQPGWLVVDPTDLSASFPYGGTVLGYVAAGVEVTLHHRVTPLVSTRAQVQPYAHLLAGADGATVRAALREWDDDALQAAFPQGFTTAGSSGRVVAWPGSTPPGTLLSTQVLLYAPEDTVHGTAALFRAVVPFVDAEQALRFSRRDTLTLPVTWRAQRAAGAPAGQEVCALGYLGDLTL